MGIYFAHADGALLFVGISMWWAYNMFKDFIKNQHAGREHIPKLSYPTTICGRRVHLENILKISFTFIGIFTEIPNSLFAKDSTGFVDDNGRFRHMNKLQHITIYSAFMLHSVLDIIDWLQWHTIKGLNYLTAVMSFLWYTIAFYYHFQGLDADPLEVTIHMLSLYVMQGAALSLLLEYYFEVGILSQLCRTLFVLTLGTWYMHSPAVLYRFTHPLSDAENPDWDRNDPMNVHFMVSMFGMHLIFNTCILLGMYACMYSWYKHTGRLGHNQDISLSRMTANKSSYRTEGYEKVSLMDAEEEI